MSAPTAIGLLEQLKKVGVVPTGATADSRTVRPGDLFLAYPGLATDGRRYIAQAVEAGACAVIYDSAKSADFTAPPEVGVPVIPAEGLRALAGYLADRIYKAPSVMLWIAGVTGTNGKTTVSQWLARALASRGLPCGVIGTLGSGFPDQLVDGLHTTPDAPSLHRRLAELHDAGAVAAAMEVSSIGLHQGRVNGVRFDVAIFTNLSRDHLDYHGDMTTYAEAKADLFAMNVGKAVLNVDDKFGAELARRSTARNVPVIGYTLDPANPAILLGVRTLVADGLEVTSAGMRFDVHWGEEQVPVSAQMVGRFNVSNLLAVIATLLARGETLQNAVQACQRLSPPAGRMQMVGGVGEPLVLIDYAHTPDALEKALDAGRETARARNGSLVCVFGCGGDRDAGKRPLMGAVVAQRADAVWLTSDNPRSEDPELILDQIAAGLKRSVARNVDRAQAIERAVIYAAVNDVIVIAGKGHENYQEVRGVRHPFSDLEQARNALAHWHERRGAKT